MKRLNVHQDLDLDGNNYTNITTTKSPLHQTQQQRQHHGTKSEQISTIPQVLKNTNSSATTNTNTSNVQQKKEQLINHNNEIQIQKASSSSSNNSNSKLNGMIQSNTDASNRTGKQRSDDSRNKETDTLFHHEKQEIYDSHACNTNNKSVLSCSTNKNVNTVICSMCYEGFEVVLLASSTSKASSNNNRNPNPPVIEVMCARTRIVVQHLHLPTLNDRNTTNKRKEEIVCLVGNAWSGIIVVATTYGHIYMYAPVQAGSATSTSSIYDIPPFGRHHWKHMHDVVIHCERAPLFYINPKPDTKKQYQTDKAVCKGSIQVCMSQSHPSVVLVCVEDRMAVYDVCTDKVILVWCDSTSGCSIIHSSSSGDGRTIAIVVEEEGFYGVRTYIRSSLVDNMKSSSIPRKAQSNTMEYKASAFLKHTHAITQLSFKGIPTNTPQHSDTSNEEEGGNDYLLTFSKDNSSLRIFVQNEERMISLMERNTLSTAIRVDWVTGISSANFGAFDPRNPKTTPSSQDIQTPKGATTTSMNYMPPFGSCVDGTSQSHGINHTLSCSTTAGAWIAIWTHPNTLSLHRLSYIKHGCNPHKPVLFQSVTATFPTGLDIQEHDFFSIRGLWPVWNACPTNDSTGSSCKGVAASLAPPFELSICANVGDCVSLLEFMLWSDFELGPIGYRNPLIHVLDLAALNHEGSDSVDRHNLLTTSITHEHSRICAKVQKDKQSISFTSYQQGSMTLYPFNHHPTKSSSTKNNLTYQSICNHSNDSSLPKQFIDRSVCPIPIRLPSLFISQVIRSIQWLPQHEGRVVLLVFLEECFYIYTLSPFWQPPRIDHTPNTSPKSTNTFVPREGERRDDTTLLKSVTLPVTSHHSNEYIPYNQKDDSYEVSLTPHTDFGIGLRLDHLPTTVFVSSYEKNPITGSPLPAEESNQISLGDTLIAVNGTSVEGFSYKEVVLEVRRAASDTDTVIKLRFQQTCSDTLASATSNPQQQDDTLFQLVDNVLLKQPQPLKETIKTISTTWNTRTNRTKSTYLLFYAIQNNIQVYVLGIPNQTLLKENQTKSQSFWLRDVALEEDIHTMEEVECNILNTWCITISYSNGLFSFLFLTITWNSKAKEEEEFDATHFSTSIRQCKTFSCHGPRIPQTIRDTTYKDILFVRPYSIDLVGFVLQKYRNDTDTGSYGMELQIWSAYPHMKHDTNHNEHMSEERIFQGTHAQIYIQNNDTILDFQWVTSGYLDAFPWLVTFTSKSVIVHRCCNSVDNTTLEWISILELTYPTLISSTLHPSFPTLGDTYYGITSPVDRYPHIIPSIKETFMIHDDESSHYIRSDWHPDSILAFVCTEEMGIHVAFRKHIDGIFAWLSQYSLSSNDDEDEVVICPHWNSQLTQGVVPFHVIWNDDDDVILKEEEESNSVATHLPTTGNKDVLLCKLQTALRTRIKKDLSKSSKSCDDLLPEPLKKLNVDELQFLYAIGNIRSNVLTNFTPKLDSCAQLFLFSLTLVRQLLEDEHEKVVEMSDSSYQVKNLSTNSKYVKGSDLPRHESFALSVTMDDFRIRPPGVAVSACIAALLSNTQKDLLSSCRIQGKKLDWSTARSMMIPFWLRDHTQLRIITDEIAQDIFRRTKHVMECAIFYIALRKMSMLKNIAQTDRSEAGKNFLSFLSLDFRSECGRQAAEKNAYSLLRKRQYGVAAAFFLLPEPPMIRAALEVIVTHMEDISLAILIARLMDGCCSVEQPSLPGVGDGSFTIKVSSFGLVHENPVVENFDDWEPKLGSATTHLLENRLLPLTTTNSATLKSLILIWLGNNKEASLCLAGTAETCNTGDPGIHLMVPSVFDNVDVGVSVEEWKKRQEKKVIPTLLPVLSPLCKPCERIILKSNCLLDFMTAPMLLKSMGAHPRVRCSYTLHMSHALIRRGIEIPSFKSLLQQDLFIDEKIHVDDVLSVSSKGSGIGVKTDTTTSSIFGSFDVPLKSKQYDSTSKSTNSDAKSSDVMNSSIFDSFDAPPKVSFHATNNGVAMKASEVTGLIVQSVNDNMNSSIFDSFDVPPKSKLKSDEMENVVVSSTDMISTIFDSFEIPQNSKKELVHTIDPSTEITASIIDSPAKPIAEPNNDNKALAELQLVSNQDGNVPIITEKQSNVEITQPLPSLWFQWRNHLIVLAASRRLIREVAQVVSIFCGDALVPPMALFQHHEYPLIPCNVTTVLKEHCDGNSLIQSVRLRIKKICSAFEANETEMIWQAQSLLGCPEEPRRIVIAVLLYLAMNRCDLAELMVRWAAQNLRHQCHFFSLSNDDIVYKRKTLFHLGSQYVRRMAVRVSWQLELCLWLNRGGAFIISDLALKEIIVSVRVGILLASWGRNHDILETMISDEPDCTIDHLNGQQLWTNIKIVNNPNDSVENNCVRKSSGWEYLVKCDKKGATSILCDRTPGSFLLRQHAKAPYVIVLSLKAFVAPTSVTIKNPLAASTEQKFKFPFKFRNFMKETTKQITGEVIDSNDELSTCSSPSPSQSDPVKHLNIKTSDTGFHCGTFGPCLSLLEILEAISISLSYPLLFNKVPKHDMTKGQSSPNTVFLKNSALRFKSNKYSACLPDENMLERERCSDTVVAQNDIAGGNYDRDEIESRKGKLAKIIELHLGKRFGMISQLLVLTAVSKQLSGVAAADPLMVDSSPNHLENYNYFASRLMRPLLHWRRSMEVSVVAELLPRLADNIQAASIVHRYDAATGTAKGAPCNFGDVSTDGSDAMVRGMIHPSSKVEFRTLRVGDGRNRAMVLVFSKSEALSWLTSFGGERDEDEASLSLRRMVKRRTIEEIDLKRLCNLAHGKGLITAATEGSNDEIRYRVIDPWEVEVIDTKQEESTCAALGRECLLSFHMDIVARSCEKNLKAIGGFHLLKLWNTTNGDIQLTKAIASMLPPWERDAGDLRIIKNVSAEPSPYITSIRKHLYRNTLYRQLQLPQRFLATLQVEFLGLKCVINSNESIPILPVSVYALLQLKRSTSRTPLKHKARTLDCARTKSTKLNSSSVNTVSWGGLARFRFRLPEDTNVDGTSLDVNRESLFKGPPLVLQFSVYEKKLLNDHWLGSADINLNNLGNTDHLEEWVPLNSGADDTEWFVHLRMMLRFELMCLNFEELEIPNNASTSVISTEQRHENDQSVGLKKLEEFTRHGGVYECYVKNKKNATSDELNYLEKLSTIHEDDLKNMVRNESIPDFPSYYIENIEDSDDTNNENEIKYDKKEDKVTSIENSKGKQIRKHLIKSIFKISNRLSQENKSLQLLKITSIQHES